MREMLAEPLLFQPGTRWEYSTPGYILLAGIIERAAGTTYEQYLRSMFERAGLRETGFVGERARWSAFPVRSYSDGGAETTLADMVAFIPSFTGFLICGALVVSRTRRAAKWAVPMFIVAAVSDEVEDTAILRLLENPADAAIGVLIVAVRLKFLMLTVGVLVARAERVAGAVMVAAGAVALTGLMFEPRILMPATLVAWVALFVSVARSR